jgi:hypothetical protein
MDRAVAPGEAAFPMANARAPSAFAASAAAGLDESRPRLIDVAIERDAAIGVFADLVAIVCASVAELLSEP